MQEGTDTDCDSQMTCFMARCIHMASDFAPGPLSTDIQAPPWTMDNLAFTVPEPRIVTLTILGLLNLALRRRGDNA